MTREEFYAALREAASSEFSWVPKNESRIPCEPSEKFKARREFLKTIDTALPKQAWQATFLHLTIQKREYVC